MSARKSKPSAKTAPAPQPPRIPADVARSIRDMVEDAWSDGGTLLELTARATVEDLLVLAIALESGSEIHEAPHICERIAYRLQAAMDLSDDVDAASFAAKRALPESEAP